MRYKLGIILLLIIMVVGLYFISGMVKIKQIEIVGNDHNSEEEILEIVGFSKDVTVLDTIKHRPKLIENKGYISKIEVSYPSITSIHINVIEKERMGYVKYMSTYLCVDANAYIIDNVKEPDSDVAKIEGLNVKSFALNESLDIDKDTKLALLNIYTLLKSYKLNAKIINLNFKKTENITIDFGKVKVSIGNTENLDDKFSIMKDILSTMDPEKEGVLHLENPNQKIIFKKTQPANKIDNQDENLTEDKKKQ